MISLIIQSAFDFFNVGGHVVLDFIRRLFKSFESELHLFSFPLVYFLVGVFSQQIVDFFRDDVKGCYYVPLGDYNATLALLFPGITDVPAYADSYCYKNDESQEKY